MATTCDHRQFSTSKGLSFSKEDSTVYNLPKKDRLIKEKDDFSLGSKSTIVESKEKCTYGGESENTPVSMKKTSSSLKFPPDSQEPEEIFGKKGCESSDDSDYEDDALTEEEFKNSEGYKLTMKCLDAMLGKPLT